MKNITLIFLAYLCFTSLQAQLDVGENDECSNAAPYGGFGPACTISFISTTIGATFNSNTDLFSCDSSSLKSSIFYTFTPGVPEVEFNLIWGENINVTVLNYVENTCNPDSTELTNNCFMGLNATCNNEDPEVLFTNLIPMTSYILAIWTDEREQTNFEFCLTRAPVYECGDGICYKLAENADNCPEDCPPIPITDECINAKYIGLNCECPLEATTVKSTYNNETDLFSCDETSTKSSVFFRFLSQHPSLEFNLLEGENVNVSLLEYVENECNTDSLELTENCFTNLNTRVDDAKAPEALFTNLKSRPDHLQEYILAVWTDESKQTDFKFCLRAAPAIECGDSICYDLVENPVNCPQDCIGTAVENHSTSFQIFPNPVIDALFINTNLNAIKNATIRIHSIEGKVWHQEKFINPSSKYSLDVSHLPEGMYGLQIYSNQINHIQKFLKLD